jgi:HTH-type transcriptional regulator/antitoxin HigA
MHIISKKPLREFWQLHPESKSIASIAHIETPEDYHQTTLLLNSLLDVVRDDASHPLYSLLSVVGDLIEAYEINLDPFQ